jgi:hypothetical protein
MFTEDLDAFLSADDFAIAATLQGGGTVNVIFDRAVLNDLGIAGTSPQALAKASAVSTANVGQTLTISGTAYTIMRRDPMDDGAFVLLDLKAP